MIPVFDIGDTLVPSRRFAEHIIEDELRQRNHNPVHKFDPDRFMMYDPSEIQEYLERYSIEGDPEKLASDCRNRYLEAFETLMIENDVFDLFARCNRELGTIGVVSDNTVRAKDLLTALLDKHGVSYDTVIVSEEVGVEKPDPRIFEAFINERDEEAAEFVYFGNDASRDSGAEKAGMSFVWVTQFDAVNTSYEGLKIDELSFENLKNAICQIEQRR